MNTFYFSVDERKVIDIACNHALIYLRTYEHGLYSEAEFQEHCLKFPSMGKWDFYLKIKHILNILDSNTVQIESEIESVLIKILKF